MVQVILWALWTPPLYHPSCFKSELNFTVCNYAQKHGHKEVCGLCGSDLIYIYNQFHFILHKEKTNQHPPSPQKTPNPSPFQNPRKPPEVIYFLEKSLACTANNAGCGKQNASLPGSQVRRMVYRVPGMKSYHNTAWYNPAHLQHLIFISFISSANFLCTFFQKAVQTGSHIFNRSPVEGIQKHVIHIIIFLKEIIFQLAWLDLRNKSTHIIYTSNSIYYFSSLARKAHNLLLAFIIFSGMEAADNCIILL